MLERRLDSIEDEEENFNNLDTNNFKPNDNLLNDNNVIKSSSSIKSGDIIGTEEMFINKSENKGEINSLKQQNNNLINEEENVNINYLQEFDIKDDNGFFEYNSLNLVENKIQDKQQPHLKLNRDWKIFNKNFPLSYEVSDKHKGYEYMELNHMAIRLIKEIDYDELGLELKLNFSLIGNSQILIFTRSFVNKEINDSDLFDNRRNNDCKNCIERNEIK